MKNQFWIIIPGHHEECFEAFGDKLTQAMLDKVDGIKGAWIVLVPANDDLTIDVVYPSTAQRIGW